MAHPLVPQTQQRGHAGYGPSNNQWSEQPTVAYGHRPYARHAGIPAHPWRPPTPPNPSAGYMGAATPTAVGPWSAPNGWGAPGPWPQPPFAGNGRGTQRWWIAASGAVAVVVAAAVAVVGFTAGHGDSHTTASGGVHVPAPPVKSAPPAPTAAPTPNSAPSAGSLVDDSALPTLVPRIAQVSRVMGSAAMEPIDKLNGPGMFADKANPAECAGAILPAAATTYSGSGARSTYVQALHDQDPSTPITVFNAVTTFMTESAAAAFVNQQPSTWQGCQAGPIVLDPDKDKPLTWTIRNVAQRDNMLSANTSLGGAPATCQRVMTAKRNVVIDVTACSGNPGDSGVALASMIAERMGQPA